MDGDRIVQIKTKHIVVVILVLTAGFLAYDSISNYLNPYTTVSQITIDKEKYQGKVVQVLGIVVPGTLSRDTDGTTKFVISDGASNLSIVYKGTVVQNLNEDKEVAVQGTVSSLGLNASQILVKCPSKYEESETVSHSDYLFYAVIIVALIAGGFFIYTSFLKRS
jgi:cytochrome c-type biogenesis protein CcmE